MLAKYSEKEGGERVQHLFYRCRQKKKDNCLAFLLTWTVVVLGSASCVCACMYLIKIVAILHMYYNIGSGILKSAFGIILSL